MAFVQVGEKAFGTGEFEPIPLNTWLKCSVFDIDRVKVKSGENAGKEQLEVTYKVTEEGQYRNREVRYNYLPLYDSKGSWSLVQFGEAVGWPVEKGKGVDVPETLAELKAIQGDELNVKMGHRPGQDGKIYNRAAGYSKLGKGTPKPAAAEKQATSWGEL